MDVKQALQRLEDVSSQVEAAVIFEPDGTVLGASVPPARAKRIAEAGAALLRESEFRGPAGAGELAQLEVATPAGSVFVVRHEARAVAATSAPEPTVGLVFYDLKSCLRDLEREQPKKPVRKQPAAGKPRKQTREKP